jgi:hypothetical protein
VKLTYHLRLSNNTYLKLYFIQRLERWLLMKHLLENEYMI